MLSVAHLCVFYENALALNHVTLEVGRGELVGVFGSNSAGKTTLLNTIAGLTHHYRWREQRRGGLRVTVAGRVVFEGEEITDLAPAARVQRGIVLCRERHPVFRDLTVGENLWLGGHLRPAPAVRAAIAYACDLMPPLRRLWHQPAGMLSGGEQQMVAIGMALAAGPRLLLMDEPLLGLSPVLQQEIVGAIRQIRQQGVTVLVAEQYARPMLPVIDRGYVLEGGTLVTAGSRDDLLRTPEVRAAYFGVA